MRLQFSVTFLDGTFEESDKENERNRTIYPNDSRVS